MLLKGHCTGTRPRTWPKPCKNMCVVVWFCWLTLGPQQASCNCQHLHCDQQHDHRQTPRHAASDAMILSTNRSCATQDYINYRVGHPRGWWPTLPLPKTVQLRPGGDSDRNANHRLTLARTSEY